MTCSSLKNNITIGFIGFGKVSLNLVNLINSDKIRLITSKQNRSPKTVQNIEKSNVEVLDTLKEVALKSDILISATSPKNALTNSKEYGKYCRGIYLDLNNISPDTTLEIALNVDNFVDGAIIGKIDSKNPVLYISGENADDLLFLNDFIETVKISDKTGDAAILKMLRSSYTKALSALLIESYETAKKYDLENEFFKTLEITEGRDFKEKSLSRIKNTLNNSKRKTEEIIEMMDYFEGDLTMLKAALDKLMQYPPRP